MNEPRRSAISEWRLHCEAIKSSGEIIQNGDAFGEDAGEREKVLTKTISGGVTVNDVVFHVSMEDLPFGGVGPSGMGSYHGIEGFREFSHARSVYTQPRIDIAKLGGFKPPYGAATAKAIKGMMK